MEGSIQPPQQTTNPNLNLENRQAALQSNQTQIFKLPVGAQIAATVVGGDKNGNAIIRFAGNDLLLSSPVALAKGANLALRVDGQSGVTTLQLLSVDGKLPPTGAQATSNQLQLNNPQGNAQLPILKVLSQAPQGAQAGQAQAASTQAAAVTTNQSPASTALVTRGIFVAPAPEAIQEVRSAINISQPSLAQAAKSINDKLPRTLNQGQEANFRISNVQRAPDGASALSGLAQQAADEFKVNAENRVLKGQEFIHGKQDGQGQAGQQAQNQPQNQAQQKLVNELVKLTNFKPTVQPAADGSLKVNALVVTSTSSQALVETKLGKVVISNPFQGKPIAPGTVLNLNLEGFVKTENVGAQQSNLTNLVREWPAMAELIQSLNNAGQNGAQAANKLAGLDSIFASRLIGFINSVKSGNLNNWLSGELMDTLDEATREQIIGKLRGDFQQLNRALTDQSQSWQTLLFPVFDGEELHQARLHVKHMESEEAEATSGSRFILEFETGYFGELQLDGFIRKHQNGSNFDLVVRTLKPMDVDVRGDVVEIFNNAQELTGFKGHIEFAVMQDFPTKPTEELLLHRAHNEGSIQA